MNRYQLECVLSEAKHRLLMESEWNDLASIGDKVDIGVRKTGKICIDIVEAQGIIGDVIDRFREILLQLLELH